MSAADGAEKPGGSGLLSLLVGVAAVAILLGAVIAFHRPRFSPNIDQATADRIRPGMTRSDVHAIVGAPPGNYSAAWYAFATEETEVFYTAPGAASRERWQGPGRRLLYVHYDASGDVIEGRFFEFP